MREEKRGEENEEGREEEERGGRGGRGGRGQGGQREKERRRMEGSVATRKVRAKRFVECFMESFRIVDFLSPIAPGWIYDGRRTRKRTRRDVPATCAARCATENIKGYYLNSRKVRFLHRRDATRLGPECFPESDHDPPSSRGEGRRHGESISVPALFRIIDVKNILEAVDQCGYART